MSPRPLRAAGLAWRWRCWRPTRPTNLVLRHLVLGQPVEVTPFFDLVLVWNQGVSFGLLNGGGRQLALVADRPRRGHRGAPDRVALARAAGAAQAALWLVLAGALGNVTDRLRFGAVVDFLDFHLGGLHWPAFNVADSAIVIGAGLLLIDGLFSRRTTMDGGRGETDARA